MMRARSDGDECTYEGISGVTTSASIMQTEATKTYSSVVEIETAGSMFAVARLNLAVIPPPAATEKTTTRCDASDTPARVVASPRNHLT
eukprot:6192531-Pleurochrysis_carterae.AAC.2